jgi:hypothetical protein
MWPIGVAPPYRARRLARALCRRAFAVLALSPRRRLVHAGCPLLWAQAIPFRSVVCRCLPLLIPMFPWAIPAP